MKRKSIITLAVSLCISLCLMGFGIYAATTTTASISGTLSYTVHNVSVLVQGKVNGAQDSSGTALEGSYKYEKTRAPYNVNLAKDYVQSTSSQYLSYTTEDLSIQPNENLADWDIGDIQFVEDKDVTISLLITNYSGYPIKMTIAFPEQELATQVTRTIDGYNDGGIAFYDGQTREIVITYNLASGYSVSSVDVGMDITFEKYTGDISALSGLSIVNLFGGLLMGKTSTRATTDDIFWRCFAYSANGTEWKKYTGSKLTTGNAKYAYFILETYASGVFRERFLSSDKYVQDEEDNQYYHNDLGDGVKVFANDYYNSDIRAFINENIETKLNIDTTNSIYQKIAKRTVGDLYLNNKFADWSSSEKKYKTITGTAEDLPTNANVNDADTFWLPSLYEMQNYFGEYYWYKNDGDQLAYWLRSVPIDESNYAGYYSTYGGWLGGYDVSQNTTPGGSNGSQSLCARVAFKLNLQ